MSADECLMTFTKTPSYLSTLLDRVEDIAFIYKTADNRNSSINDKSFEIDTFQKNEKKENIGDVTGSPLKVDLDTSSFLSFELFDDCTNFWQKNEETYHPISYEKSKKLIEDYWKENYKNKHALPVWCLCDGTDDKKTLLLTALRSPTAISRTLVTRKGYLPKNHPNIAFDAFCNEHFKTVDELTSEKQKIPLRQLACDISSIYELYGSKITINNFKNCNLLGSVYLEIKWNVCSADIPINSATSIMTVQTIVGQENSAMYRFWKELLLLELYTKVLTEYNSEDMLNNDWLPSNSGAFQDVNLIDQIVEMVNDCHHAARVVGDREGKKLLKIVENVDNRETYDITDKIWDILNKCSTYGNLKDCLNVVFTEIAQTENKILVSDSNITVMAQMIRDIMARRPAMACLTGTQPIEILVDIGLQKLQKDFNYICSEFDITSAHKFNDKFKTIFMKYYDFNNADPSKNIDNTDLFKILQTNIRNALYHKKSIINYDYLQERIKILGQLHIMLETLLLVPTQWQSTSLQSIYEHYVENSELLFDSFATLALTKLYEVQLKLAVSEIYEYVKILNPVMWRMSLTYSKHIYSVQSVFHLAQRPIFPPALYTTDLLNGTALDANEIYYHYSRLTNVANFI